MNVPSGSSAIADLYELCSYLGTRKWITPFARGKQRYLAFVNRKGVRAIDNWTNPFVSGLGFRRIFPLRVGVRFQISSVSNFVLRILNINGARSVLSVIFSSIQKYYDYVS